MFVTVIVLKCALLVSQRSYAGHFLKLIQYYLNNTTNLRHLTQRIILCCTHTMAVVPWPYTLWRHFATCIGLRVCPERDLDRFIRFRYARLTGVPNTKTDRPTDHIRTSAGFWLGESMPPCRLRRRKSWKFDYEMVHSEVYLNKYLVSIAPFSTPACPDCSQKYNISLNIENCSFLHVFDF